MKFSSDSQRRAAFANMSRFSTVPFNVISYPDSAVGGWKKRKDVDFNLALSHSQSIGDFIGKDVIQHGVDKHPIYKEFEWRLRNRNDYRDAPEMIRKLQYKNDFIDIYDFKHMDEDDEFSRASEMVEKMKGFKSSREAPAPDFITMDDNADIAAVIAGTKPAALVGKSSEPVQKELLDMALNSGFVVEVVKQYDPVTGNYLWDDYVVGRPENVSKILELVALNVKDMDVAVSEEHHRELGLSLGYDPQAIEDFIISTRLKIPYADTLNNYNKAKGNMLE